LNGKTTIDFVDERSDTPRATLPFSSAMMAEVREFPQLERERANGIEKRIYRSVSMVTALDLIHIPV
jgi:hypothetical protein